MMVKGHFDNDHHNTDSDDRQIFTFSISFQIPYLKQNKNQDDIDKYGKCDDDDNSDNDNANDE